MILTILIAALTPVTPPSNAPFVTFSRSASLIYITEIIWIATDGINPTTNQMEYKVHYTWEQYNNPQHKDLWIDSRKCSSVRTILLSMQTLKMPKPAPTGIGPTYLPTMDGTYYHLNTPSSFDGGQIDISGKDDTSLGKWVDQSIASLSSCLPR